MASFLGSHLQGGKQVLAAIEPIHILSPCVTRILGANPGPYTLRGTNTYLIGKGPKRILFDTGEGKPQYLEYLLEAMKRVGCEGLEAIIISHYHIDHLGGVPSLHSHFKETTGEEVPVYKYMPEEIVVTRKGEGSILPYDIWPKEKFIPLKDGQQFKTTGATLKLIYTPGHANDHMIAHLEEENVILCGDNVLGEGTGVFSDLPMYLNSLQKMFDMCTENTQLYPAHGPTVTRQRIVEYIDHRMERVRQVESVLKKEGSSPMSVPSITKAVYPADLPDNLFNPAKHNTLQVLNYLKSQGVVVETSEMWALRNNKL